MLEAVSARLAQEKVRDQFTPGSGPEDVGGASFSARLSALASERRLALLLCLGSRPRTVTDLAGLCGFDSAIAAEDLELLGRRGLAQRDRGGVWSICCPALGPSIERLVQLVLRSAKEAT
jgi:hypothetical protein